MSEQTNRQWLLARRPVGMVSEADFEFREVPLPEVGDGEYLVRNLYISFDPAMRAWMEDRPSYIPPVQIASDIGQERGFEIPGVSGCISRTRLCG